jgi:ribosomal protein S18 acetylase RimI-like enzyme
LNFEAFYISIGENKNMEITYREDPLPSDIDQVLPLVESSGFFSPEEISIAIELIEERLSKGTQSGYFFLFAEFAGNIIGYSCFGPIPGTMHSYDIYWIVVHNNFRRRGIGKTLMARTENLIGAQGGCLIYIDTSSQDLYRTTRMFYSQCGYRKEAFVKDFYKPGDGKIIYVKAINP